MDTFSYKDARRHQKLDEPDENSNLDQCKLKHFIKQSTQYTGKCTDNENI